MVNVNDNKTKLNNKLMQIKKDFSEINTSLAHLKAGLELRNSG